jgi:iron complex outermembrane recepter protein
VQLSRKASILAPFRATLAFQFVLILSSASVYADEINYEFDIKPQLLGSALTIFSKITDYQFIYTDAGIAALNTAGVKGSLSADIALEKLLEGTITNYRYTNENTILVYLESNMNNTSRSSDTVVAQADSGQISHDADIPPLDGSQAKYSPSSSITNTGAPKYSNAVEEVVVTALRRESSLQDTPIAISALTSRNLERMGADDFLDFIGAVPGLNVRDNGPGQTRPIIRGIFSRGEPQVGVYFDEAIITGAPGTTNSAGRFSAELKPFDIERIEIIKGPQGTLYGGGSMGGTIRFITNKPDASEFEGKFSIEGSSVRYGATGYQLNGMANFPLIQDKLALRMVAYKRDDPGFVDNIALDNEDINDINTEGGRVALSWIPTDKFTATGTVFYQNQKVGGGFHFNPTLGRVNPKTNVGSNEPFDDEYVLYNLALKYNFSSIEALYSYTYFDRNAIFRFHNGFTGIPFPPLLSVQPQPTTAQTHELRLTSSGKNLVDWTVGIFYSDRNAFAESRVTEPTANGNEPDPVVFFFERTVESSLIQRAIFGEATWHVNGKLDLTAGVRYFDIDNGSDVVNIFGVFNTPVVPKQVNVTRGADNGSIFKVHSAYKLTDDILFYAQFSQGFRPGGANQNSSSITITDPLNVGVPESFKSDSVDNYELGFHMTLNDGRMILNGAIFHIDWSDIVLDQRSPSGLFSFLNNADSADVDGIELEAVVDMTADLRFTSALTYLDAKLSSDGPINRLLVGALTFSRSGLNGDRISNVPKWTLNMSMDYGRELPWWSLRGIFYMSVDYTGESFSDFNEFLLDPDTLAVTTTPNVVYNGQGDYAIVDMRIGLESEGDWSAFISLENIFDKRGVTHVFEDHAFRLVPGLNFVERPRTIGVVFNKDF